MNLSKPQRIAAGMLAAAFVLFAATAPALDERVTLRASFTAPAGSGQATFEGTLLLHGKRTLLAALVHGPVELDSATEALRSGVTASIATAGPPELDGDEKALPIWGIRLEGQCERAMAAAMGGSWDAQLRDGFELIPGGEADEATAAP